jgi:Immunity protein 70
MGLYLCVFEDDEEIDGVEIGAYADFNGFREYIVRELEAGKSGSKFPTLILHSDCDGEWSPEQANQLKDELLTIVDALTSRPPAPFTSAWQRAVSKSIGLVPRDAFESFIDVDGITRSPWVVPDAESSPSAAHSTRRSSVTSPPTQITSTEIEFANRPASVVSASIPRG